MGKRKIGHSESRKRFESHPLLHLKNPVPASCVPCGVCVDIIAIGPFWKLRKELAPSAPEGLLLGLLMARARGIDYRPVLGAVHQAPTFISTRTLKGNFWPFSASHNRRLSMATTYNPNASRQTRDSDSLVPTTVGQASVEALTDKPRKRWLAEDHEAVIPKTST